MGKRAATKAPAARYVKGRVRSEVAEWVCQKLDEAEATASDRGTTMVTLLKDLKSYHFVSLVLCLGVKPAHTCMY